MRPGVLFAVAALAVPAAARVPLTGINLAGGEFGGLSAVYGKGYVYPDAAQMRAFRARGMNLFRIPLRWERLQPVLGSPLDAVELARLDRVVETATLLDATVIIDVHNYARYRRQPLGSAAVPAGALRDLWVRIAQHYRGNDRVVFGLMNEPVKLTAPAWAAIAQDTVRGIRATGAANLILVPGTNWSGAHSWAKPVLGGPSNATALAGLQDPARNIAFDFHQYFDSNSSGTTDACVSPAVAEARLQAATTWLRATGNRGMLTEFAVTRSPACAPVLTAVLRHMDANPQWVGWTVWASAAWFGTYRFNLYPFQAVTPTQLDTLQPFLAE